MDRKRWQGENERKNIIQNVVWRDLHIRNSQIDASKSIHINFQFADLI